MPMSASGANMVHQSQMPRKHMVSSAQIRYSVSWRRGIGWNVAYLFFSSFGLLFILFLVPGLPMSVVNTSCRFFFPWHHSRTVTDSRWASKPNFPVTAFSLRSQIRNKGRRARLHKRDVKTSNTLCSRSRLACKISKAFGLCWNLKLNDPWADGTKFYCNFEVLFELCLNSYTRIRKLEEAGAQ